MLVVVPSPKSKTSTQHMLIYSFKSLVEILIHKEARYLSIILIIIKNMQDRNSICKCLSKPIELDPLINWMPAGNEERDMQ